MKLNRYPIRSGIACTALLCLSASACALPPAVAIASYAADGVSFIATGKSVTDHAVSAVAQQDCALYRVLLGSDICRSTVSETTVNAEADDVIDAGNADSMQTSIAAGVTPSNQGGIDPRPPKLVDSDNIRPLVLHNGQRALITKITDVRGRPVWLEGYPRRIEVYGLIQPDGALEVFDHDPLVMDPRWNIRMVLRILDYASEPGAFVGIRVNGAYYHIDTILA